MREGQICKYRQMLYIKSPTLFNYSWANLLISLPRKYIYGYRIYHLKRVGEVRLSNMSMARDLRVWLELPGNPHLHFPGDWYIPPPHTSQPIRARVEACWPIKGRHPQQVPRCGNTDQGSLLWPTPMWDDEIKHSQMGWHFLEFLL